VCGHHHSGFVGRKTGKATFTYNNVEKTVDFDNGTPQIIVCGTYAGLLKKVSSASAASNNAWITLNSEHEDCFRIISVDTTNKYLKVAQIGREMTYQLKVKTPICIDYKTYAQFDELNVYNPGSIVSNDGFLWRLVSPKVENGRTDWNSSIKVMYNRVIN
jgi:hypothetical protein